MTTRFDDVKVGDHVWLNDRRGSFSSLDEVIEALTLARDAVNGVEGNTPVEVWIDQGAEDTTTIRDIISDVNGVSLLLEVE